MTTDPRRARGRTCPRAYRRAETQARDSQTHLARLIYEVTNAHGTRRYTVTEIAAEFGVTRPTIYRHLGKHPRKTPNQH